MSTRAALHLVEAVARASDGALREHAACVRALVDEIDRHHPREPIVASLHDQLGEELERVARIAGGSERPLRAKEPLEVLVVDDDEAALSATVKLLTSFGYACRSAGDGREALDAFRRRPTPIVLSDWTMPHMTGLELCQALKQEGFTPYVILATAFQENERVLEGVRAGVDDFLLKPIDVGELEVRLLAASRLLRAIRLVAERHAGSQ